MEVFCSLLKNAPLKWNRQPKKGGIYGEVWGHTLKVISVLAQVALGSAFKTKPNNSI
jgi:hypothetical protein